LPFSVRVSLVVERQSRPCHDLTKIPSVGGLPGLILDVGLVLLPVDLTLERVRNLSKGGDPFILEKSSLEFLTIYSSTFCLLNFFA
jgi:hypothetical protein